MINFNPLNFIANHAGMNLADAIKEAYEQGKKDAQPERKKGKWINNSPVTMKCDQCGYVIKDWRWAESNFCANCGADMRGEQDDSV